ncbi:MAG: hypothetical protein WDN25_06445 [Acetobacteraceae bacterium]
MLACCLRVTIPPVSLSAASASGDARVYRLDHRHGPLDFHLEQGCLHAREGQVARYRCDLRLGRSGLPGLWIDLELEGDEAAPPIRFRSTSVSGAGDAAATLRGLLEIGGVIQLQTLDAVLAGRRTDPITGTEVADLAISGALHCSLFGLVPPLGPAFDRQEFHIALRIELDR